MQTGSRKKTILRLVCLVVIFPVFGCGGGSTTNTGETNIGGGQPSFSISVNPAAPAIQAGGTSMVQVSVSASNGFNGEVSVSISGLPTGISAQPTTLSLTPGGPPQELALSAQPGVSSGSYPATLQGVGGGFTKATPVTIAVGTLETFSIPIPLTNSIALQAGSTTQEQIETTACCPPALGGFLLNFSVSGLPSNVTASFSPNPAAPGTATTLTISAAANAAVLQNQQIAIVAEASAGGVSRSVNYFLDVTAAPGATPNSRSDFIRTDGTPAWMVYDNVHQLIYASNLEWNRVDIVSPVTKQVVATVPIPNPQGLDISLDGSRVYVGSQTQQMFAIDTAKHAVVQRWLLPASAVAPPGQSYGVVQPIVTSTGSLLLLQNVLYTTGSGLVQWDPATNTISPISLPPTFEVGFASRSADGRKVIVASNVAPGEAAIYDAASGSITASRNFQGFIFAVQSNPTGTQFIIEDDTAGLLLYDVNLNPLATVPPGVIDTGVLYSPDGSRIYVVADVNGAPATYTVDANSLRILGIAPALATIPPRAEIGPNPFVIETPYAVDSTGLIFGASPLGIALDDATYYQNLGAVFPPTFDKFLVPDAGPVNAATTVTFQTQPFYGVPSVWFGAQPSLMETLSSGFLQVVAPPAPAAGPVNVKVLQPDGSQIFDPLAFSYGPAPLFLAGDSGSPSGGATADIIALGVPTDPSAIQVSVGGIPAEVVSATNFVPGLFPAEPFPAVDVQVKLPSGTSQSNDVTVSTSAGSGTLPNAYRYVSQVEDYPSGDTFQAITYDGGRNQLYLAAGDHIDVFSLANKQFVSPLSLPSANGSKKFVGMALTPDGSKLIVANLNDTSVDIVNPDDPSTAVAVSFPPGQIEPSACPIGPSYVATTNTGLAFVVYGGLAACGPGGSVYQLNLSTLAITFSCVVQGSFVSASRDGSKVAFGGGGWSIYDSASGTCAKASFAQPYGAAAAGDANVFAAGFRTTDVRANLIGIMALPDPYYPSQSQGDPIGNSVTPLTLEKMNDAGSLLYIPFPKSVDILDVNHVVFRQRVTLTENISQAADAMAIDTTGQNIFLITDHGLTIVTLSAAPLSVGNVTPNTGSAGTLVVIRGSGFTSGTTVNLNGQPTTAAFVDADTLTLSLPALPSGAVQFLLSNPDGQTYRLDNAFNFN